jgi:hypothetical protein
MKAEAMSLTFLGNEGLVRIPFFQRGYVWNIENWDEILIDLLDFNKSHFLGSIILKYDFFDLKICQYRSGDAETEYFACISQRGNGFSSTLYPQSLTYNRFPIMNNRNSSNSNKKDNLQISFFCPLENGLVSVRKFDYSFDKEKIKNITRFTV